MNMLQMSAPPCLGAAALASCDAPAAKLARFGRVPPGHRQAGKGLNRSGGSRERSGAVSGVPERPL